MQLNVDRGAAARFLTDPRPGGRAPARRRSR